MSHSTSFITNVDSSRFATYEIPYGARAVTREFHGEGQYNFIRVEGDQNVLQYHGRGVHNQMDVFGNGNINVFLGAKQAENTLNINKSSERGNHFFHGGEKRDMFFCNGAKHHNTFIGGDGNDEFICFGYQNQNNVMAGKGNDYICIGGHRTKGIYNGGPGNDRFSVVGDHQEVLLDGEKGDDEFVIYPAKANRIKIQGGSGNNRLILIGSGWEERSASEERKTRVFQNLESGTKVFARRVSQVEFRPMPKSSSPVMEYPRPQNSNPDDPKDKDSSILQPPPQVV